MNNFLYSSLFLLALSLVGCSSSKSTDSAQSNPRQVVELLFKAAQEKDFSLLENLCDPEGENDGDTKRVCNLSMEDEEMQNQFVELFENGKIMGVKQINTREAKVDFLFGADQSVQETMNLVKRGEKWYLSSF